MIISLYCRARKGEHASQKLFFKEIYELIGLFKLKPLNYCVKYSAYTELFPFSHDMKYLFAILKIILSIRSNIYYFKGFVLTLRFHRPNLRLSSSSVSFTIVGRP